VIWVGAHLPAIQALEIPKRPPTIQIVGFDGSVLATRGEMPGANVSLKDLPPYLPKAFDRDARSPVYLAYASIDRQIGRQILQRDIGAGHFAARPPARCHRSRQSGWSAAASEFQAPGSLAGARPTQITTPTTR